ncbi:MAG: DpnD/PcfM family protein [Treponema sp.]|jgi:hypothetical protein|nr:DpnD/PcfM family protein [Treponema sp.]
MKTYKVTITEKLQPEVEAEAASRYEAERLVEKCWQNGDYILDAGHFRGVTFRAEPPQKERGPER